MAPYVNEEENSPDEGLETCCCVEKPKEDIKRERYDQIKLYMRKSEERMKPFVKDIYVSSSASCMHISSAIPIAKNTNS